MLKTTLARFARPTLKPMENFLATVSNFGMSSPYYSRLVKLYIPAALMVIMARQRMRFVAVCTKRTFIGSISPNVMYIFLLIRLRP